MPQNYKKLIIFLYPDNSDFLYSAQQTKDGGYVLGGFSNSDISGEITDTSQGGRDYWIIKVDANGNKIFDKNFGGTATDILYSLQQTADGGYILGGCSNSDSCGDKTEVNQGGFDYWIVKIDANGNKEFDKTFGGSSNDMLYSLQQTSDGGYILGGYSYSDSSDNKAEANQGGADFWIIKIDANGNKEFDKTFGGSSNDMLYSLQQTVDGGYILGGRSNSDISGDKTDISRGVSDYWIVKIDANGNKEFDKTFGGSSNDMLYSLLQTSDGGYLLGGSSYSDSSGDKTGISWGDSDYWIVKVDSKGNKEFDRTFGGSLTEGLFSILQTSGNEFILGGYSYSDISGNKSEVSRGDANFWIVKMDAYGNFLFDKTFGGNDFDQLRSLNQTSDGGLLLCGTSGSDISGEKTENSRGDRDFWIIKLGSLCESYTPTITSNKIVNFCDAGKWILNAENGTHYMWNTGDTTQDIKIDLSGNYMVSVTDSNGCIAVSDTVRISYHETDLLSSYTILANKKIDLSNNTVYNGSIGISDAEGKAKFNHQTDVSNSSSFVKSPQIKIGKNSFIANPIYEQVKISLPDFEKNTHKSKNNIVVQKNKSIILSDSVYGNIVLGNNSTILFTEPVINIKSMVCEGKNSIIKFIHPTQLRIRNGMNLGRIISFNPDSIPVVCYVAGNVEIEGQANITAIIYAPKGKINIKTKHKEIVAMKGLFIAKSIHSEGNVIWQKNNICYPFATTLLPSYMVDNTIANKMDIVAEQSSEKETIAFENFLYSIYPNPFTTQSELSFNIQYDSEVTITLFNMAGRKITTLFNNYISVGQTHKLTLNPSNLAEGIYFYQLVTKQETITAKLVYVK